MAINEKIVTGKKLRRFINGAWERISFWHKASDCEMNNGNNLETEIQDIRNLIQNNKTANEALKQQALVYNKDTDYYQGYIGGQWKDVVYAGYNWDGYIIRDGWVTDDNVSGGLIGVPAYSDITISSTTNKTPLEYSIIEKNKNNTTQYMDLHFLFAQNSVGSLYTVNLIDFTNYTKLKFEYFYNNTNKDNTTGYAQLGLTKSFGCFRNHSDTSNFPRTDNRCINLKTIRENSREKADNPTNDVHNLREVITFDISNFVGKYYLFITLYYKNYSDVQETVKNFVYTNCR